MNTGAPSDNWSARAPIILAFSNLVNVGGPVITKPLSLIISAGSCGVSWVTVSRFSIILHSFSICAISFSVGSLLASSRSFR
jgi:hypothetical protein